MSRAAYFSLSQLRTSTSAGRVRLKPGVMPLPDSTLTPRWAQWQNSTITLCRWLWRVTTSPPHLQVVVWLPRLSRAKPGHREHKEPLAVYIPSHHWMEICSSLGSRCRSRPGEGVTSSQDAGTEISRALSAGDDASNNKENLWSSSFFDSTLWWTVEVVIASTEIISDGETSLLKRSTM